MTLIERASRFNLIGDLPEGHDATSVFACCIELIERVPAGARRTLTWDQGTETACHDDLAAAVGIDVFFAEPVRHEALCIRAVVKGHRLWAVAAVPSS
jgi:IS30 family transposase